ncbi:MAG: ABC transporter permease [Anaerolineae bacterium]|nr:MAG: ABC transporter permease [Anaerolineae bacterium]
MKNWQLVFWQEVRNQFRRKAYLFSTFGIPLIALLAYGGYTIYDNLTEENKEAEETIQAEFEGEKRVGYVDLTGSFPSPDPESPFSQFVTRYDDFSSGEAAIENDEINRLYVIEEDYFESGRVSMWLESFNVTAVDSNIMDAFLLYSIADDTDPYVIARLRVPTTDIIETRITQGEVRTGDSQQDFWLVYAFSLVLMVATFGASGYLMQSVVEEKESMTIEIILTSVRPLALLVGKLLAMALTGLFQIGLWMAVMVFIANQLSVQFVDFSSLEIKPSAVVLAVVYFFLGFGLTGGFFAAIASIINTTREGSSYSSIVTLPSVVPFFFITAITEDPNSTLAVVLSLIPFTAPLTMIMRSSLTSVPTGELIASMALMVIAIVVVMWMATRLFRVNTLLRGSVPKLKDIPKLIFQG